MLTCAAVGDRGLACGTCTGAASLAFSPCAPSQGGMGWVDSKASGLYAWETGGCHGFTAPTVARTGLSWGVRPASKCLCVASGDANGPCIATGAGMSPPSAGADAPACCASSCAAELPAGWPSVASAAGTGLASDLPDGSRVRPARRACSVAALPVMALASIKPGLMRARTPAARCLACVAGVLGCRRCGAGEAGVGV